MLLLWFLGAVGVGAIPPAAITRAKALVAKMTLDEKIQMLHGNGMYPASGFAGDTCLPPAAASVNSTCGQYAIPRLKIPPVLLQDGPQGVKTTNRKGNIMKSSTQYPALVGIGASWDPAIARAVGIAMGAEFRGKGANNQEGPGLNIHRVPYNGRNCEYVSGEDPNLGAVMASALVDGIQSQGVVACAKHFVANNQEQWRQSGVSANIDERTLHQIYYPAWEAAINAGLGSIMCAYNKVNGDWACENEETLHTDLRSTLGFQGFIVSDWGARHDVGASVNATLDMDMPGGGSGGYNDSLKMMVLEGKVANSTINAMVTHVLAPMIAVGVLDRVPCPDCVHTKNVSSAEHNDIARVAASSSMVLLQNKGKALPINPKVVKKLAVIGLGAHDHVVHMTIGSGQVDGQRLVTPLQGLLAQAPAGVEIIYLPSLNTTSAAQIAAADAAVVVVGTTAGEGHDRDNLTLCSGPCTEGFACPVPLTPDHPGGCGQDDLVAAVAGLQPERTAVVVSTPGAIIMPWKDQVASIVIAWLPGQEFGSAIADILFGSVNPTGRLPLTLPTRENEMNMTALQFPGVGNRSKRGDGAYTNYTEGLKVGYRWYSAHRVAPAFAFGHGLSYTQFDYSDLAVSGRNVSFRITNKGDCSGAEIGQAYLTFPAAVADEPPHQLRWFQKTKVLAPGESEQLHFGFSDRDFSIWDSSRHGWRAIRGQFGLGIGASSADTRLEGKVVS